MPELRTLLIANRGEIAVRIIRSAREFGLRTVAIASDADALAMHARLADEVVMVGPASAAKSYLDHEAVLAAAAESGADAVHPGYGFLSESAEFARKVQEAGLVWVGPSPEAIELMGDKARAIQAAVEAGVPTVPGTGRPLTADDDAEALAEGIGYPLAIKAAAGGGGRGIRIVHEPAQLRQSLDTARAEARAAFGDDAVYLERFIANARHVEVQILGDGHDVVHFYGRDCSMQRRHQKIIEEAGVPNLPEEVAERMHSAAVALARRARYVGAGTVEFLYDANRQEVAFIEMNTRLQVEHPVTELVTDIDLVREQLRIAAGERLGYAQDDIAIRGHAIEFRINAEDPARNFLPSPGRLDVLALPGGPGVRLDFGVEWGDSIAPYYDSLIGKIIVFAGDREAAIERAARALAETRIEGIATTLPILRALIARPEFAAATHTTRFIESTPDLLGGHE